MLQALEPGPASVFGHPWPASTPGTGESTGCLQIEIEFQSERRGDQGTWYREEEPWRMGITPTGTMLDARYLDCLQQPLRSHEVRLRCEDRLEAVLIVVDDEPVGVIMPMAY
jgi:hypothetical protein